MAAKDLSIKAERIFMLLSKLLKTKSIELIFIYGFSNIYLADLIIFKIKGEQ
jgi:hypothetical protein